MTKSRVILTPTTSHRLKHPIVSPLISAATPETVLDPTALYTCDLLP
ncbi:hypothetical protein [Streptomyces sp. NPDC002402]